MSKFGWSYPPGAAGDPFAPYNMEEGPCECCGHFPDDCICPECGICGTIGRPDCYKHHGMQYSSEQLIGKEKLRIIDLQQQIADAELYIAWLERDKSYDNS